MALEIVVDTADSDFTDSLDLRFEVRLLSHLLHVVVGFALSLLRISGLAFKSLMACVSMLTACAWYSFIFLLGSR